MTDSDKLNQTYYDEGWGHLAEEALRVKPEHVENAAREVARHAAELINDVLDNIDQFGQIDGAHHKAWVIDQTVRKLTGDRYQEWLRNYCAGEDGPETYEWDEGIAP